MDFGQPGILGQQLLKDGWFSGGEAEPCPKAVSCAGLPFPGKSQPPAVFPSSRKQGV